MKDVRRKIKDVLKEEADHSLDRVPKIPDFFDMRVEDVRSNAIMFELMNMEAADREKILEECRKRYLDFSRAVAETKRLCPKDNEEGMAMLDECDKALISINVMLGEMKPE